LDPGRQVGGGSGVSAKIVVDMESTRSKDARHSLNKRFMVVLLFSGIHPERYRQQHRPVCKCADLFGVLKAEPMNLTSANDDFLRTLKSVPGLVGKICYMARLRNDSGDYEHWGLKKIHGYEQALESMATAHKIIFAEILRSRLANLYSEAEAKRLQCGDEEEFLKQLQHLRAMGVPRHCGKRQHLHFSAVIEAVLALAASQYPSNHRDA
jgi:hypothetical protein